MISNVLKSLLRRVLRRYGICFNVYTAPELFKSYINQMFAVTRNDDEIKFIKRMLKLYDQDRWMIMRLLLEDEKDTVSIMEYLLDDSQWIENDNTTAAIISEIDSSVSNLVSMQQ